MQKNGIATSVYQFRLRRSGLLGREVIHRITYQLGCSPAPGNTLHTKGAIEFILSLTCLISVAGKANGFTERAGGFPF